MIKGCAAAVAASDGACVTFADAHGTRDIERVGLDSPLREATVNGTA
jgi:hypothetical protein